MEALVKQKRKSALEHARTSFSLYQQWIKMQDDAAKPQSTSLFKTIAAQLCQCCEDLDFIVHAEADFRAIWTSVLLFFRRIVRHVQLLAESSSGLERDTSESIERTSDPNLVYPSENTAEWEDIVCNDEAKEKLSEVLLYPEYIAEVLDSELLTPLNLPAPCRTVLVHGPPGTGKTMLVKSAARVIQAPIYCVTAADFLSQWLGESEKAIRKMFKTLKQTSRCILFMDEVDAIFSVRAGGRNTESREADCERRIKTEFLICLQDLLNSPGFSGFFIAATNLPSELDIAFLRRFDARIEVPLPNIHACSEFIRSRASDMSFEEIQAAASKLVGLNYADMQNILRAARMRVIRAHIMNNMLKNPNNLRPVTSRDIELSMLEYNING